MKFLIPLVATVAAVFSGWKYTEAERERIAAETRVTDVTRQLQEKKDELQALRAANAGRTGVGGGLVKPGEPKSSLVEEKLRNWKSPFEDGVGGKLQRPPGR